MSKTPIPFSAILEVIETFLTAVDWAELADAYMAIRDLGFGDEEAVEAIVDDLDASFDWSDALEGPVGLFLEAVDAKVWRTLVRWKIKGKLRRATRRHARNMKEVADTLREKAHNK